MNVEYGYAYSIIVNWPFFYILGTTNQERTVMDEEMRYGTLPSVYDEEYSKVTSVLSNTVEASLFTMAAVLNRLFPDIKVLVYNTEDDYNYNTQKYRDRLYHYYVEEGNHVHYGPYCFVKAVNEIW